MDEWVAEYSRDRMLFNVITLFARSQEDAVHLAWQNYMQLADCIRIDVYKIATPECNPTSLSERRDVASEKRRGKGFKKLAA